MPLTICLQLWKQSVLTASLIAVLQLTETCIRIGNTVLGPTEHSPEDLKRLKSNLYRLYGTLQSLRMYYHIHEEDEARLRALSHLDEPYKRCEQALTLIEQRLESKSFMGKYVVGTRFDLKLKKAMDEIAESKTLFETALLADNSAIPSAVEQYLRNVAEDIRDIGAAVNENGKRLRDVDERLQGDYEDIKRKERDCERRSLLDWLSPLEAWAKHEDVLSRRCEGTGDWLLDTDQFQSWLAGFTPTLLCLGIPGAGKTVLTSIAIQHLNTTYIAQDIAVAMIYFTYNKRREQSLANLFGSILKQLLQNYGPIPDGLRQLYRDRAMRKTCIMPPDSLRFLEIVIRKFSRAFIAVDALDECSEETRQPFLNGLFSLQPKVQLLFTSRFVTSVETHFCNIEHLEIRASKSDLMKCLSRRLPQETLLSRIIQPDPTLRNFLLTTIVEQCHGMFLLAQFHVDALARKHYLRQVRKGLQYLPVEIDSTYDDAMERITDQTEDSSQLAFRILSWLVCAKRPLRVEELLHALAVDLEDKQYDEEAMPDESLLVSLCAGLVTIEHQSRHIRLVHHTTQEYFERNRQSFFPNAACDIANTCLIYLNHDWTDLGPKPDFYTAAFQLNRFPFLEYASVFWCDHVQDAPEYQIFDSALRFLEQDEKINHCLWMHHVSVFPDHNPPGFNFTGLAMASTLALYEVAKTLITNGADVNTIVTLGGPPTYEVGLIHNATIHAGKALHSAAFQGHERLVSLLLDSGASLEEPNIDGIDNTALHCAIDNNKEPVARLLLRYGASPTAKDKPGRSSFHVAVERGLESIAALLLIKGADVENEAADWSRSKPLHLVHHPSMALWLLERGAQVESKDQEGYTPLLRAVKDCGSRTSSIVALLKMFVNHGASLAATTNDGHSALHLALYIGNTFQHPKTAEQVLRLLLDRGANKEAKYGTRGLTPLLFVCDWLYSRWFQSRSIEDICMIRISSFIRILLEAGANASSTDEEGLTPLHYLAKFPKGEHKGIGTYEDFLMNVKRFGSDPRMWDSCGITGAYEYCLVDLMYFGADPKARDSHGRTASDIFELINSKSRIPGKYVDAKAENPFLWDGPDAVPESMEALPQLIVASSTTTPSVEGISADITPP